MGRYHNERDHGRKGRNMEEDGRLLFKQVDERCHPLGVADMVVKRGVTVEFKTGCGWLVSPIYDSKEEVEEMLDDFKMVKAMYVCYLPEYDGTNIYDAIVITQKKFLTVFRNHGKIRVKKGSNGLWGIAIQSYIPTPTFKASVKTYEAILQDLADNGMIIEEFAEKYGLNC